jgi:nitrous oxidase accessory protein
MERTIQITILALLPLIGFGHTWEVSMNGTVSSIRQAVVRASPGDTILVEPGIYLEKGLLIDKALVLRGIGQPVLDGQGKYEIVSIKSDNVTLEGFCIRHSGYSGWKDIAAVRLYGVKNAHILGNILEDTFFGIYSQNTDNCSIEGNILSSNGNNKSGNGIHCWHCNRMHITGNQITRHRDGIYFEFVTNSLIRNNRSYQNVRYGLHFMFSHNDRYEGNTFQHNEAGVSVMFSHGVDMEGNTFEENLGGGAYGILLKEISDSRIQGNHFIRNTIGIYMEGTTRVGVAKNTFIGNGWAMKVQASCSEDTITHNNFTGNTFDVATNGTLVLNTFDRNYWDKYEGYDLNHDGIGDIPYHPVSMYAMIAEKNPAVMMLFHSFMVSVLDKSEKVVPSITPVNLIDHQPAMKPFRR